jgi:transcriptional regulator NrdR family protein
LKCPTCTAWTSVDHTKNTGGVVERRRRCANNHTFTTEERVAPPKKRGRPVKEIKDETSKRI